MRACIHHDQLIARARKCIVPVECLFRMWEFTTACKGRRHTDEVGDGLLLRPRLLSTPALNSSEKSDPLWRFKLIRGVAPGLEERIGQDCIVHDSPPQGTCQDPAAPCTI